MIIKHEKRALALVPHILRCAPSLGVEMGYFLRMSLARIKVATEYSGSDRPDLRNTGVDEFASAVRWLKRAFVERSYKYDWRDEKH